MYTRNNEFRAIRVTVRQFEQMINEGNNDMACRSYTRADVCRQNAHYKIIISSSSVKSKTFNPCQIIIRQPRKKWGERIGDSSRRDSILGVFACANSMNF